MPMWRHRQRLLCCCHKPKTTKQKPTPPKAGRGKNRFSPMDSREKIALPIFDFGLLASKIRENSFLLF
jgi:hypothetical protein